MDKLVVNNFNMYNKQDEGYLSCFEMFFDSGIESKPPVNILDGNCSKNVVMMAARDQVLVEDERVLSNLINNEELLLPENPDYFRFIQIEVKPHMRKVVTDWMLEVCQEMECPPPVFCLAVRLMDRFLAKVQIVKNQLQLLGSTCLFLASKFKETKPIPSDRLVMYTDFSISVTELKDWELLVLYKLKWDLSSRTAMDFLDNVLLHLPFPSPVDPSRFRCHVETIITLCSTHYIFTYIKPSLLAAAAIATAIRTICETFNKKTAKLFFKKLESLTRTDTHDLEQCSNAIIKIMPKYLTTNIDPQEQSLQLDKEVITRTSPSTTEHFSPRMIQSC